MGQNPDAQSIQSDIQRSLSFVGFITPFAPPCSWRRHVRPGEGRQSVTSDTPQLYLNCLVCTGDLTSLFPLLQDGALEMTGKTPLAVSSRVGLNKQQLSFLTSLSLSLTYIYVLAPTYVL